MAKNLFKQQYQDADSTRVENNQTFYTWWHSDSDRTSKLIHWNDKRFKLAFGPQHFVYTGSGYRTFVWLFKVCPSLDVYILTDGRGTSYEFVSDRPYDADVGQKLIDFMLKTVVPVVEDNSNPALPSC